MNEVDGSEWDRLVADHQPGTWAYLYEKSGRRRRSWTYDSRNAVIADADKASKERRERVVGLVDPSKKRHQWQAASS